MNRRPDFIPREMFRAYLSTSQLDKIMKIGNMSISGFISRRAHKGRPIKCALRQDKRYGQVKTYRPIDLMAHASIEGLAVADPIEKSLESPRVERRILENVVLYAERKRLEELRSEREALVREIEELRIAMHYQSQSLALIGTTLLTHTEIVAGQISVSDYKTKFSGVYFLINENRIVYVGQSVQIFVRVLSHIGTKKFDSFSFVPCDPDKLDILESLYIHMLRPELNGKKHDGTPNAPLRLDEILSIATTNRLDARLQA